MQPRLTKRSKRKKSPDLPFNSDPGSCIVVNITMKCDTWSVSVGRIGPITKYRSKAAPSFTGIWIDADTLSVDSRKHVRASFSKPLPGFSIGTTPNGTLSNISFARIHFFQGANLPYCLPLP